MRWGNTMAITASRAAIGRAPNVRVRRRLPPRATTCRRGQRTPSGMRELLAFRRTIGYEVPAAGVLPLLAIELATPSPFPSSSAESYVHFNSSSFQRTSGCCVSLGPMQAESLRYYIVPDESDVHRDFVAVFVPSVTRRRWT